MTEPSPPEPETLDQAVRRSDPDRWLAARFIGDAEAQADVIALYGFNDELARIAPAVTNPLMGEIRLAWWREALDEIGEGRPVRRHPVAQALAAAAGRGLDLQPLYAMIEARGADLDKVPFTDEAALFAYLHATAGSLMNAASAILGGGEASLAARAWGVAGLARAHWAGAPNRLPPDWSADRVRQAVSEAVAEAGPAVKALPVAAFPAVAYAALAPVYAARRLPSELERRARLVWAVGRGRIG